MSVESVAWALRQCAGGSSSKLVLLVLAEAAGTAPWTSQYGRQWGAHHALRSIAALCEATELDRKTVIVSLRKLEEAGLIQRAGTDGRTNQIPVFRLELVASRMSPSIGAGIATGTNTPTGSESGTGAETGTVPILETTGTAFPADRYRFSPPPVPKAGHGTMKAPEHRTEPGETRKRITSAVLKPADVDGQTWTDWHALRKAKHAPITETVLTDARSEADKVGMTLEQFLRVWCARGSQGLRAEWLKPTERASAQAASKSFESKDYRNGVAADGSFT